MGSRINKNQSELFGKNKTVLYILKMDFQIVWSITTIIDTVRVQSRYYYALRPYNQVIFFIIYFTFS